MLLHEVRFLRGLDVQRAHRIQWALPSSEYEPSGALCVQTVEGPFGIRSFGRY